MRGETTYLKKENIERALAVSCAAYNVTKDNYTQKDVIASELLQRVRTVNANLQTSFTEPLLFTTNVTDMQCFVVADHFSKTLFVSFRGSESLSDWYHDLLFRKRALFHPTTPDLEGLKVHRGIFRQLLTGSSYTDLKTCIDTFVRTHAYTVCVTGHSLGGGLATLFSYLLALRKPDLNVTCITFASPRIGNKEFKKHYQNTFNLFHLRCTCTNDLVSLLPVWNYHHTGEHLDFQADGTYRFIPLQDDKTSGYLSLLRAVSLEAHKVASFVAHVKQLPRTFKVKYLSVS